MNLLVINPKRVNEEIEDKPYWYNYYAGYSHSFAKSIIDSSKLTESSVILDPWNGAGTTTLMSSLSGYRSVGIDLNPVMKVIAKAKQATVEEAVHISLKLQKLSSVRLRKIEDNDPLEFWFHKSGVLAIRKVEHWILGAHAIAQCSIKSNLYQLNSASSTLHFSIAYGST